jgi:hypothetical protein
VLYHFAITPDVFEPALLTATSRESVILVELLRGIADNGLLANLQAGAWHTQIRSQFDMPSFSPDIRDKLRSCLTVVDNRNRLIRHPAGSVLPADDDFRWLRWAVERHQSDATYPMKGVVSTDAFMELSEIANPVLVQIAGVLDHPCWQDRPKSIRFPKTKPELQKALKPLLRYANLVTLIDPYMTPTKPRFFDTVQYCADLLGSHDGQQRRGLIHIHAGDPMHLGDIADKETAANRLDRWERELQPVIAQWKYQFEVFLWRNQPGGKAFHDRYLITEQCGISAPGGLDFEDDPTRANLTSWSWLEPAIMRDVLLNEFHRTKSPYQFLGSRRIP